jgi:hypothetical protein
MASSLRQPAVSPDSSQTSIYPDLPLIDELYKTIESSTPTIKVRKLLIQQLMACGWSDAARDNVSGLLSKFCLAIL